MVRVRGEGGNVSVDRGTVNGVCACFLLVDGTTI